MAGKDALPDHPSSGACRVGCGAICKHHGEVPHVRMHRSLVKYCVPHGEEFRKELLQPFQGFVVEVYADQELCDADVLHGLQAFQEQNQDTKFATPTVQFQDQYALVSVAAKDEALHGQAVQIHGGEVIVIVQMTMDVQAGDCAAPWPALVGAQCMNRATLHALFEGRFVRHGRHRYDGAVGRSTIHRPAHPPTTLLRLVWAHVMHGEVMALPGHGLYDAQGRRSPVFIGKVLVLVHREDKHGDEADKEEPCEQAPRVLTQV